MKIILYCVMILSVSITCFAASVGSSIVLNDCFSPKVLAGESSDLKVSRRHKPDLSPPSITVAKERLQSVEQPFKKSIRYVIPHHGEKVVALTFDLCELTTKRAGYDYQTVNVLRRYEAGATFFAGGKWMKTHPEKAKQLMADPLFEIGNHGWTHGNFGVMDNESMHQQIEWTQAQYELLRGELLSSSCTSDISTSEKSKIPKSIQFLRLPYGRCSHESLKFINEYGLKIIQWSVVDARQKGEYSSEYYAQNIYRQVVPGSIVLLHANGVVKETGSVVTLLLEKLSKDGYRFVTVSELLNLGNVHAEEKCYFSKEGDNLHLDAIYGDGTQHPVRK